MSTTPRNAADKRNSILNGENTNNVQLNQSEGENPENKLESNPVASRTRSRTVTRSFENKRLTRSAVRTLQKPEKHKEAGTSKADKPRRKSAPVKRKVETPFRGSSKMKKNNQAKRQRVSSDDDMNGQNKGQIDEQSINLNKNQTRSNNKSQTSQIKPEISRSTTSITLAKHEVTKPNVQKPVTQKPTIQKPASQKQAAQKPATQKPATQKPTTQKPAPQKPTIISPFGSGLSMPQFIMFDPTGQGNPTFGFPGNPFSTSTHSRWARHIDALKTGDVNVINELCDALLMGNEETLHAFPTKQCLLEIQRIIQQNAFDMEAGSELPNLPELQLLAMRCITYLMEALPRSTTVIIGMIPDILKHLIMIQCIDTAEQALLCLYKLTQQSQGKQLLLNNAPYLSIQHIDFFSSGTQRHALQVCLSSFQALNKFDASSIESNSDVWGAISGAWPILSGNILKSTQGDKGLSYLCMQSLLQIIQSCTLGSNKLSMFEILKSQTEAEEDKQEEVTGIMKKKREEKFFKLFLGSKLLENVVEMLKDYVDTRSMIESENHNQNPFIVVLKILSLISKEIPEVPPKLYKLGLIGLLISCLKIIHDSDLTSDKKEGGEDLNRIENLKNNDINSSPTKAAGGNQSPNTNRQFSTQLIYEILVQICPRKVSSQSCTLDDLNANDLKPAPINAAIKDMLLYLDDNQTKKYLLSLKSDNESRSVIDMPKTVANHSENENLPENMVSDLINISFYLYNNIPSNSVISHKILYLLDLLANNLQSTNKNDKENEENSGLIRRTKVPETQWRPISAIVTSLLQDQHNLKKVARACSITNALMHVYGEKLPSQFKRDGMLFEMRSMEKQLLARNSEETSPATGFTHLSYNITKAHKMFINWTLVSIQTCIKRLESMSRTSVTDGMLESVTIQISNSNLPDLMLFKKIKDCLLSEKPFSVYEIRSSQILSKLFQKLTDKNLSFQGQKKRFLDFMKIFDKQEFEKLVLIIQQVLGTKFSSLITNSFYIGKNGGSAGSSGVEINSLKGLSKGQVRLAIMKPGKHSKENKLILRVDPNQTLVTIAKFLFDRGYTYEEDYGEGDGWETEEEEDEEMADDINESYEEEVDEDEMNDDLLDDGLLGGVDAEFGDEDDTIMIESDDDHLPAESELLVQKSAGNKKSAEKTSETPSETPRTRRKSKGEASSASLTTRSKTKSPTDSKDTPKPVKNVKPDTKKSTSKNTPAKKSADKKSDQKPAKTHTDPKQPTSDPLSSHTKFSVMRADSKRLEQDLLKKIITLEKKNGKSAESEELMKMLFQSMRNSDQIENEIMGDRVPVEDQEQKDLKFYYNGKFLPSTTPIVELIEMQLSEHYTEEQLKMKPVSLDKFWTTNYKVEFRMVAKEKNDVISENEEKTDNAEQSESTIQGFRFTDQILKSQVDDINKFYSIRDPSEVKIPNYQPKLLSPVSTTDFNFFTEKHADFNEMFDFLTLLQKISKHHSELESDTLEHLKLFGPLKTREVFVEKSIFFNTVLIGQVESQLNDLFSMASKSLPDWLWQILENYQWLIPFELRKTFFDVIFMDHNRSTQTLLKLSEKNLNMARPPSTPANIYSSANAAPTTLGRERLSRKRYYVNRGNILREAEKLFSTQGSISPAAKPKYLGSTSVQIPSLSSLTKVMTDAYTCLVSPPRRTRQNSLTIKNNKPTKTANTKQNSSSSGTTKTQSSLKTDTTINNSQSSSSSTQQSSTSKPTSKPDKITKPTHKQSHHPIFGSMLSPNHPYTSKTHLTTSLEFSFVNEVGTGTGPTLEFYNLLSEKMLEKTTLFTVDETSQLVSFAVPQKFFSTKLCSDVEKYCLLLGRIMARALLDNRQLPIKFSETAWRQIMAAVRNVPETGENGGNENPKNEEKSTKNTFNFTLQDISDVETFNSLVQVTKSVLDETFTVQGCKLEDLCLSFPNHMKNLKNTEVTKENAKTYLMTVIKEKLDISSRLPAFYIAKGMTDVFYGMREQRGKCLADLSAFDMFMEDPEELNLLFGGESCKNWTVKELFEAFTCGHGYDSSSVQLSWLCEFLVGLPVEEKKLFLTFVTGGPNGPIGGLKAYQPPLTLVRKLAEDDRTNADDMLPSAMTCQNYLKLPPYTTKEILAKKMKLAYTEGNQHFLLS